MRGRIASFGISSNTAHLSPISPSAMPSTRQDVFPLPTLLESISSPNLVAVEYPLNLFEREAVYNEDENGNETTSFASLAEVHIKRDCILFLSFPFYRSTIFIKSFKDH
jgi:hypothetical protein